MSKKNRNQRRQRRATDRRNSSLADHAHRGKTLTPPILNLVGDAFKPVHWERDDLPDQLLVCNFLLGSAAEPLDPMAVRALMGMLHFLGIAAKGDQPEESADSQDHRGAPDTSDAAATADAISAVTATGAKDSADAVATNDGPDVQAGHATSEEEVSDHAPDPPADAKADLGLFAGRLTQFEALSEEQRGRVLAALHNEHIYETLVPEELAHVLGMYPSAPGRWLIQPWLDSGLSVDPAVAERRLSEILEAAGPHQGDIATRAKGVGVLLMAIHGRLHLPESMRSMARVLTDWPHDIDHEETAFAESTLRAMYGGVASLINGDDGSRVEWAKAFWRANWFLYQCRWPQEPDWADVDGSARDGSEPAVDAAEEGEPDSTRSESPQEYWRRTLDDAREAVSDLRGDFQQLANSSDPDLYDTDRHEVLTGLVGRVLRYLDVFAGYPPLWTMEHGAPLLRTMVEARIVLAYLVLKDDPDLYAKFKSYGMGKLKLLKLHLENLVDETEDPPAEMTDYIAYLDSLVNQDIMEEFQTIDLGGGFANIDTRKMAAAVDMESEYRLVFAPASSNVHGEWSILDEYVFDRCRNPTHRRHRVVRKDEDRAGGANFMQTVLDHAGYIVEEYRRATATRRLGGATTDHLRENQPDDPASTAAAAPQ